jgi:hypothetical protein
MVEAQESRKTAQTMKERYKKKLSLGSGSFGEVFLV